MKYFLRATMAVAALSAVIAGAGCVAESPNITSTNTAATTTTNANISAMPKPSASPSASANNVPVTLPVLDAMFTDEAFASELKARLQLTDEQIDRLRTVAREETGKLRETDAEDYSGTTANARRRADEQIKSVIGGEKAGQLAAFVGERWEGGGGAAGASGGGTAAGSMVVKPNAVPTDTRVVVNAPAYRMDVFENGQLMKTYKIGIGYPEFPLPTGERRADTVIFNPTWTPPDEPWVEAPSSKVKVGEKVDAGSPLNPLGPIKIPIGLPSLIHGGKSPAKLGTFASHGCVGLTNQQVQDFAQVLGKLGGTEITPQDVAAYAKTKTETKNVKLSSAVPVELRYETIVVSDGKLHIYRDVYDRGTNTEENLRAALEAHGVSLDQLSEAERGQVMTALKEMARDASGKLADGQPSASPGANANANMSGNTNMSGNANVNRNQNANTAEEKITRTVKGKKEVMIPIAALAGKGYPAPVGADVGGGKAISAGKKR